MIQKESPDPKTNGKRRKMSTYVHMIVSDGKRCWLHLLSLITFLNMMSCGSPYISHATIQT